MNFAPLINPAGGLYYHLSAWRFKDSLWLQFRYDLAKSLAKWQPLHDKILIFGSSGGYNLTPAFVNQFSEITLVDPDPLAPLAFKKRFKRKVQWINTDFLDCGVEGLLEIKPLLVDHSLLFSNILGQLPLICPNYENSRASLKSILKELLTKESWFSFHDLFSFNVPPERLQIPKGAVDKQQELIDLVCQNAGQAQVCDHLTFKQLPETENQEFFFWPRKPRYTHLIEACFQNC